LKRWVESRVGTLDRIWRSIGRVDRESDREETDKSAA